MRRILAIFIAAAVLSVFPPAPKAVEARSLFETLFPKTAERRKLRKQRERARLQRLLKNKRKKKKRVAAPIAREKPKYYTYKPRAMASVRLKKLSKAFAKAERQHEIDLAKANQKAIAELQQTRTLSLDKIAAMAMPAVSAVRLSRSAAELPAIKLMARKDIARAVESHYASEPSYLWIGPDGNVNEAGREVLAVLADAEAYGLSAYDYTLKNEAPFLSASARVAFEFELTSRALRYFSDARHGLVDANRISVYHDFSKNKIDAEQLMAALAAAPDRARLLLSAHPKEPAFAALKAELLALSGQEDGVEPIRIKRGTFIKPGAVNAELPKIVEAVRRIASPELKSEHALLLDGQFQSEEYSPEVVALVKDAQKQLKLSADGIVGKNTIRRLLPKVQTNDDKREKIKLAMERLRWHPDKLGRRHVFINQPAYRVAIITDGQETISMNVVVGKKANQTNFFHDEIEYVEYNPYWGVPRSILVKEMLPKLRRNSAYLDNLGYEVTTASGRRISSTSVNWYSVGSKFPFNVRQPPGPKNALGSLKIMFPNRHAIYMHDTPAKSLFSRQARAFSHGCVRLENPHAMAAAVLGTSVEDVRSKISIGQNEQERLSQKLPVYVSYFTAWPTTDGEVKYYSDIYDRDAALQKALVAEQKLRNLNRGA